VATDAHKWLNVPYDSGLVFVADHAAHRCAMSTRASYLVHAEDGGPRDQIDWNPEWSRRGRGVALYAALRSLGRTGLAELIERTSGHAATLVDRIGALPGVEILSRLTSIKAWCDSWLPTVITTTRPTGSSTLFRPRAPHGSAERRGTVCGHACERV